MTTKYGERPGVVERGAHTPGPWRVGDVKDALDLLDAERAALAAERERHARTLAALDAYMTADARSREAAAGDADAAMSYIAAADAAESALAQARGEREGGAK